MPGSDIGDAQSSVTVSHCNA